MSHYRLILAPEHPEQQFKLEVEICYPLTEVEHQKITCQHSSQNVENTKNEIVHHPQSKAQESITASETQVVSKAQKQKGHLVVYHLTQQRPSKIK